MIRLLLNGKAADSPELRESVAALRRTSSIDLQIRVTWEKGDALRFVSEAVQDGARRVIAAGGDGTLHEVVNGLAAVERKHRPILGIIPMGTANDFARSCLLPDEVNTALKFAVTGSSVDIDIIKVNEHFFINVATSGFGAEVTASTPPELKRFLGGASYALMGIILSLNLQPHDGEMHLPGASSHKGSILVGAVGNGRQAGGGITLTPRAFIDDGLVDVLYVRQFPLSELGLVLQELSSLPAEGKYVGYVQTPWFDFEHPHPISVNLDGEACQFQNGRVRVHPAALPVVLPDNCPLLVRNRTDV
jgi:lipid kinase YegS